MSIEISHETEARLTDEARKHGISVNALLERLIGTRAANVGARSAAELPVWHLGGAGSLRRRDIYDDVR
jgi:hypothetical protein